MVNASTLLTAGTRSERPERFEMTAGPEHPDRGIATVRTVAFPKDTNSLGDIFGGWLMSHADVAGAILAYRRAGGRVVTVAVKDFQFLEPVYVGDIVAYYTRIDRIGTTSITVAVSAYSERHGAEPGVDVHVAEASITYVHIDEAGKAQPVPESAPKGA